MDSKRYWYTNPLCRWDGCGWSGVGGVWCHFTVFNLGCWIGHVLLMPLTICSAAGNTYLQVGEGKRAGLTAGRGCASCRACCECGPTQDESIKDPASQIIPGLALRESSFARDGPMYLGSSWDNPQHGWMPNLLWVSIKQASGDPTRKSQLSANSNPPG